MNLPETIDRIGMAIFKYPAALSGGIVCAINLTNIIGKLEESVNQEANHNPSHVNEGNIIQRFRYGYRFCRDAFTYSSK